jgi:hypothetical protein
MRAQDWKGLITDASPYVLPPGAATEQVNLRAHISGQLITRGGMNALEFDEESVEVVDIYPYMTAGTTKLVALRPNGTIVAFTTPVPANQPAAPSIAGLSPASGQVQSNYIGQFKEYGGESPV